MGSHKKRKHHDDIHSLPATPPPPAAPLLPSAPISPPPVIKTEPGAIKPSSSLPPSAALLSPRAIKAEPAKVEVPARGPPSAALPTPPAPQSDPGKVRLPVVEAYPVKDTPLALIMGLEQKRPVYWRSRDNAQIEKNQAMLDSGRKDYEMSALITSRGAYGGKTCENCLIGRGKFTRCVTIERVFGGACGNCVWGGEGVNCSHTNTGKIRVSALARLNTTREEVDKAVAEARGDVYQPRPATRKASKPRPTPKHDPEYGSEHLEDGTRFSKRIRLPDEPMEYAEDDDITAA